MDATAEAILDGLDDAQRMAATAVRGPVRIIAGAGAGKTRTVTQRSCDIPKELVLPYSLRLSCRKAGI